MTENWRMALDRGYRAVADELRKVLPADYDPLVPLAKRLVDVWSRTTNPVGLRPADTIYDELYRLRAVTRLALMAYDEGKPVEDYMEALRAALIAMGAIDPSLELGGGLTQ